MSRPVAFALAGISCVTMATAAVSLPWFSSERIEGRASVIDGDTLDIGGQRVRLEGIDAPETAQSCGRAGSGTWACGKAAAKALEDLIDRRRVSCRIAGRDKYGRSLAVCQAGDVDLNAAMVRRGFAWAFVKYSNSYVKEETEARAALAGIWQGEAQPAWDFRQNRWQSAETAAPAGCAIKGNVTGNGRIYHMPWSPWYGRVKIDAARGERWFCSESDAQSAGWRPVESF